MPQFCPSQRSFVSAIHAPGSPPQFRQILHISKMSLVQNCAHFGISHTRIQFQRPMFSCTQLSTIFLVLQ